MLRSLSIVQVFQLFIFHCFLLGLEKYSYAAENKQNTDSMTEPVLGLDLDARILPLYRRILMDPNRKGLVPPDEAGLARLEQALAKDRQNLAEAKPERQAFLRSRLFERLVLKALYWQSVTVGELVNSADSITSNRNLLETHQEIFVLGPQIIKDTSNTKDRASILLQVLLAQAQYDDKRGSAMKNLEKIKSQFTHPKHLELIDFLLALEALETADLGLKKLAVKQLEVLANRMDRRYSSLASLAIARSLAGFASNGRPSWEASPDFASYTRYVSRLCQKLSPAEKNSIFDFSLSIWALQSKFDNQWDPVPFNLGCYEEAQQFPAFLERLAMASARRKQVDRAIALYKHLDSKLKIPVQKQQINLRMAYLMRDDIKNGQYRDDYQDFLMASQASFRGTHHGIRL
ncbi:MAG: hypothetical protein NTX25_05630, partial [Proteobacteria bacterium]|nr:hypothetical protein [Pseudomonadota bacterium]